MKRTSRTGPEAHSALARDLVELLEHDMQYLGWFVAIARAYPERAPKLDWAHAMDTAHAARMPLQVAEALLRAQARPKNHRARAARPGAISRHETRNTKLETGATRHTHD